MVSTNSGLRSGLELYAGFRLRQLRGIGSLGSVWEAEGRSGPAVAFKFLSCLDEASIRQELRTMQLFQRMRHPNLVPIEQVWCYQNYVVATMPLADGSLQDMLDAYLAEFDTAMPADQVCLYLAQAAKALDYLNCRKHESDGRLLGFQHCDVKPSNLLLFGDMVKVADFNRATMSCSVLKPNRPVGTPGFIAPEVLQGRLSDWTDQYALAVTYCLLRTGRLPFPEGADTLPSRPAPDLSLLSEKERPIVSRALAAVPRNRWPSCSELMTQLTEASL